MIRVFPGLLLLSLSVGTFSQEERSPVEVFTYPLREDMRLEVTGAASLPDGGVAFVTRRGDAWVLNNPRAASERFRDYGWSLFARGLHRPERILAAGKDFLLVKQRRETTRLRDRDGDGRADEYLVQSREPVRRHPVDLFAVMAFPGIIWEPGPPRVEQPFAGQVFGGNRLENHLVRLALVEDGPGKHASLFVFQRNLKFPVDALVRIDERSWICAQSNRHDVDRTRTKFALQRIALRSGELFEIESVRATENGFHLAFTGEVLRDAAAATWSYAVENKGEEHAGENGEMKNLPVSGVRVDDDLLGVELLVSRPEPGTIYRIACEGVWSKERMPVRNPVVLFVWNSPED